jgi:hypothetical protein
VYFTGDRAGGRDCPADEAAWKPTLDALKNHIGLTAEQFLAERIHDIYLPALQSSYDPERGSTRSR